MEYLEKRLELLKYFHQQFPKEAHQDKYQNVMSNLRLQTQQLKYLLDYSNKSELNSSYVSETKKILSKINRKNEYLIENPK